MELDKICKDLDDLAVHYFQILDDLSERKRKLELLLKEGFLNLSKARYSMGNRAVSALQYDSNVMKALVDVSISEEDDTSVFELARHKPRPRQSSQSDSSEQQQEAENSSKTGRQVRRRNVKSDETRDSGNIQSTEESFILEELEEVKVGERKKSDENKEDPSLVDPLHWFGILVPSALRQGQTNFVQAVEHSVRIASLQNQLMSLQEKYKALYQTKKQLKLEHDKKEQKDSNVEELTSNMNGVCVNEESDHI